MDPRSMEPHGEPPFLRRGALRGAPRRAGRRRPRPPPRAAASRTRKPARSTAA